MHSFKAIGLLTDSKRITIDKWQSLVRASLESRLGIHIPDDSASLHSALSDVIPSYSLDRTLSALTWLSQQSLPSEPPAPVATPIDLFAMLLQHKLRYAPHERDLVVLGHEVITRSEAPEQQRIEVHSSSLVVYGTPTASAMARCVGLPIAFAALLVLDGSVRVRGVTGPADKSLYRGILERMEEAGLAMREAVSFGCGMEDILEQGLDRMGRRLGH
jgi:alpha-aminoadipic semialdehyde synthase